MSSFLATDESPGKMYALAVTLTLLAIVAVILRSVARRLTKSGLAWDDFLIVIALLVLAFPKLNVNGVSLLFTKLL